MIELGSFLLQELVIGPKGVGKSIYLLQRLNHVQLLYGAYAICWAPAPLATTFPDGTPTGVQHFVKWDKLVESLADEPAGVKVFVSSEPDMALRKVVGLCERLVKDYTRKGEGPPVVFGMDESILSEVLGNKGRTSKEVEQFWRATLVRLRHLHLGLILLYQSAIMGVAWIAECSDHFTFFNCKSQWSLQWFKANSCPTAVLQRLPHLKRHQYIRMECSPEWSVLPRLPLGYSGTWPDE